MIGIYGKVYILFNEVNQRSIQQRCQFWSVLFIAMKKFSSSLVLLCLAVSFLLLVCSHDGEAAIPLPKGSINAPKRREMRKSEVTEQFHFVSKCFRLLLYPAGNKGHGIQIYIEARKRATVFILVSAAFSCEQIFFFHASIYRLFRSDKQCIFNKACS